MSEQRGVVANTSYRWTMLAVVYLTMLAFGLVFQSIPPILSLLIEGLHMSHAEAGLLMSLFGLPGVLLSIPIGMITDRYGPRRVTITCLSALILGSLMVIWGGSFPVMAAGRVIAGAGGLSLIPIGAQTVSHWFTGRELGIATGVFSTAMPVATVVSLNTSGAIANALGWRSSLLVSFSVAVLALVTYVALQKPAPLSPGHHGHLAHESPLSTVAHLNPLIWLVGLIWMLFNCCVISFVTFGPDYFVARGYGIEFAGFLVSFLMLLSPPLSPLVGYLIDRSGREEFIVAAGGLLLAGSIFLILHADSLLILLLVLLGIGNAFVPTSGFALPPKILQPRHLGTGFGIVSGCLNLGMVVGPYVSGVARDVTGSYEFSFYAMSGFALLFVAVAGVLYALRTRAKALVAGPA